ncbi:GNAT family N-acetyltransferase [Rhodoblastus acidophilus]|uniref:GNAT family N-acetyltransferase n=1 Tax=Rhodoblastus acidophilus TaxID=1074 RepID=UPI0022258E24|nr:GNAT family N-acetyltransferase [Rhodoblastus acidophilus]
MNWRIERLRADQIDGFHSLLSEVVAERVFLATLTPPPIDRFRDSISRSIGTGGVFVGAHVGAEMVGCCEIQRFTAESRKHCGGLAMAVAKAWRRRGLGAALMTEALTLAFAEGLERIDLQVRDDNLAARRLYEKFGFQVEGLSRGALKVDGVAVNLLGMGLLRDEFRRHSSSDAVAR